MIGRMEIWLNPACSKCKAATVALDGSGEIYTVRRYLEAPPTHEELEAVLARLGMEPWDLVRMSDPAAKALETLERAPATRAQWVDAMVKTPSLIQRPIITASDGTTVVGRNAEALEQVIAAEKGAGDATPG